MTRFALTLCAALLATAARAEDCPPAPDIAADLGALITRVQNAGNEMEARQISNEMWALWADAPNAQAQEILDRGMRKRASYDLLGAIADFDVLVAYCPDYAEGYNQRAFAQFIGRNYEEALADLDRAIALSPNHIAAITGKSMTLIGLGRNGEAALILREALRMNPWLSERRLLEGLEAVEEEI